MPTSQSAREALHAYQVELFAKVKTLQNNVSRTRDEDKLLTGLQALQTKIMQTEVVTHNTIDDFRMEEARLHPSTATNNDIRHGINGLQLYLYDQVRAWSSKTPRTEDEERTLAAFKDLQTKVKTTNYFTPEIIVHFMDEARKLSQNLSTQPIPEDIVKSMHIDNSKNNGSFSQFCKEPSMANFIAFIDRLFFKKDLTVENRNPIKAALQEAKQVNSQSNTIKATLQEFKKETKPLPDTSMDSDPIRPGQR